MCAACDMGGLYGDRELECWRGAAKRGAGNRATTTTIVSLEITCGCGKNINKLQIRHGYGELQQLNARLICLLEL